MYPIVSDIIDVLENLAPQSMAEAWDNVGLQVGDRERTVKTVWIALDPTHRVVQAACRQNVDLLITHHPLIFKPLLSLDFQSAIGSIIGLAVRHDLAIFAAHTNLDSTLGGINDILAGRIGLRDLVPLAEFDADRQIHFDAGPSPVSAQRAGIGRVGQLDSEMALKTLALKIKNILKLRYLKLAGDPALAVKKSCNLQWQWGKPFVKFYGFRSPGLYFR